MAEAVQNAPALTQKRPLEEPSSPSGPNDQPEAKRPALDKLLKDNGDDTTEQLASLDDSATATGKEDVKYEAPGSDDAKAVIGSAAKQEDTVVPDAPVRSEHADAILTASTTNGSMDERTGSHATGSYQSQDESQFLHLRAIITSAEAATVIGKGGENVTQIRKMAGAKCTVSEYSRGAVERILTVSGPVDAVAKAFGLIIRTINQEPLDQSSTSHSKTYPLRLLIPNILIGSIIGKQGMRIREVQEVSGARLNASDTCLPLCTERSLVILGVADSVHIATYYVGSTLVEQLTDRFGGPAASAYAVRHGGPQGVVPGGMQVVPYVPQHAGGQMGHQDKYRQHPEPPSRAPSNPYGMPYMQAQPPHPQQPMQPMHYGAGSPRAPYAGAGPQQPSPYAGYGGPQQSHAGPPQQPPQQAMVGQPVTQQIFIPNDMVGAIIGKGGAKINEIRQLSGSVIKINEPQDNNNERLVTITGTQECNQMALYMLYSRLGESSKNSNSMMPR